MTSGGRIPRLFSANGGAAVFSPSLRAPTRYPFAVRTPPLMPSLRACAVEPDPPVAHDADTPPSLPTPA